MHHNSSWVTVAFALLLGLLACDLGGAGTQNPMAAAAQQAAGCPDLSSPGAIAKVDWQSEFGLEAEAANTIEGGLQAALSLREFAQKLDGDLKAACGGIAEDLGASGSWKDGTAACRAALDAMAEVKSEMGAQAQIALAVQPPRCAVSMDAMADCVAECDAELQPGEVDMQCEGGEIVGKCSGQCQGTCHMDAGAQCDGTCKGACTARFKGQCGGECTGKCSGKKVDGARCTGTCVGSCSAGAEGSCGGTCKGSCELKGSAKCSGECQGQCSVDWEAPRCTGEVKPPKASAECEANCEAKVAAKVECQPARVVVQVDGAANADAVAKYKAALENNLPAVLEIAISLKDRALRAAGDVTAVVEAGQQVVSSASGAAGGQLVACVTAPFKAALDAAASIRANVDVSVEVQASASASASASGSASGQAG